MNNKTKVALGISLALILSGCGQTQSAAEKACQAYKSGDREATIKAFGELYRENPAYKEVLEAAIALKDYEISLKEYREKVDPNYKDANDSNSSQSAKIVQAGFQTEEIPSAPSVEKKWIAESKLNLFCS